MQSRSSLSGESANLDLIRAVAVISVFAAHLQSIYTRTELLISWRFAQMGVIIFFVHTSLVLMLSLERAERRGETLVGDFYIRRFFRLMPLCMFCITLAFFITSPTSEPPHWTWLDYALNMTLTMNLAYMRSIVGVTWTLALELQMYVVLPFLFLFARNRTIWALAGIWVMALVAGYVQPKISGRLSIFEYAPCFIGGVVAWRLSLMTPRTLPGWLWPFAFVMVWPIYLTATHEHHAFYSWAFCIVLGLTIPWFQEMELGPLNKIAHFFAKYSYGIYLSHTYIIEYAFKRPWPLVAQCVFLIAAAVTVPILMYHLIEHPMVKVGQRLIATRKPKAALQPA
jgi:peptidoglycan/LPS O-acetylase OafA/YrhL